jgi:uncharacterized protein YyaL (SSP411 family)
MVDWLAWHVDAFARAKRERRPVLLSITAAWCQACHEMDRTTYVDPSVVELIRERFIPVRVDTDRRPDINERYNLGGWPTTAFLTPDGDLIAGGTFVPVDRMPGVLQRVAAAFDTRREEMVRAQVALTSDETRSASGVIDLEPLIESVFATFDEQDGGFGVEPKFPHAAAIHLALALFDETGAGRWRFIAERTLDAMADGGLWDRRAGGFYRYATTRDWQLPHTEKLLETNAALLRVYADAARVLGRTVDRDRTSAIATFITAVLRSAAGGYHGSDADPVLYADANAAAGGALLAAAAVLDDSAMAQEALASFERVVLACYKPGFGMAHYFDGAARVRGLLSDQVATIGALLDAHDASDVEPYQMMAEEIGYFVVRDMWDPERGGFFDRTGAADDIGLLRKRRKPFVPNAEAAAAFARLQGVSHEFDFGPYAAGALQTAGRQVAGQGPLAAHYVLARRAVAGSR